jgi:hypothetical protein
MPPRERRAIDGLFGGRGQQWRIVEVDEAQHFNEFRAATLHWRPKPPLFPMDGGRHRQRAFRDALADLLPSLHGFAPTLRIAHFEVQPWIWEPGAPARLRPLVEDRM